MRSVVGRRRHVAEKKNSLFLIIGPPRLKIGFHVRVGVARVLEVAGVQRALASSGPSPG